MSSWKTKNDPSTATMKMRNSMWVFAREALAASLSGCWPCGWPPAGLVSGDSCFPAYASGPIS